VSAGQNHTDDASDPYVDLQQHGTAIIANLFACAPDVSAIAVKKGLLPELAFEKARSFNPHVISFSVGYDLGNVTAIPADYVPLAMQVVQSVVDNIVVVAAAGNFGLRAFPAMMPECLAVGGVDIDAADQLSVSATSSSFVHPILSHEEGPGRMRVRYGDCSTNRRSKRNTRLGYIGLHILRDATGCWCLRTAATEQSLVDSPGGPFRVV
jgi:hypothetical protein